MYLAHPHPAPPADPSLAGYFIIALVVFSIIAGIMLLQSRLNK